MPVFAVLPDNPSALREKIATSIPQGDALALPGGAWFVSFPSTSKELAEKLGIHEGIPTGGVITLVSAYWGRATPDVWEWLGRKLK